MNVSETLDKRGKTYGEYTRVGIVSQNLKDILRSGASWSMTEPYMRESLDMLCNKLSRIVNGNPYYADSWHDIAGYATLVEVELNKGK